MFPSKKAKLLCTYSHKLDEKGERQTAWSSTVIKNERKWKIKVLNQDRFLSLLQLSRYSASSGSTSRLLIWLRSGRTNHPLRGGGEDKQLLLWVRVHVAKRLRKQLARQNGKMTGCI